MPFFARDSISGNKINISDWLIRKHVLGNPLCVLCNQVMHTRAVNTIETSSHFAHYNGTFCPSIAANAIPYQQLTDIPQDRLIEAGIKVEVFNNIHSIFNKCSDLIPNLSYQEFTELIEEAERLHVWRYVGLNLEHIPYLLTTCCEYFSVRSKYRPDPIYYVFGHIPRVDLLWIHGENQVHILHQVNRRTSDVEEFEVEFDLVSYPVVSTLTEYRINQIEQILFGR